MGLRVLTTLLLTIELSMVNAASAALEDHGIFVTDTQSEFDWLKIGETLGQSYDYVSTRLGVGGEFEGWRYAGGEEFEQLLINIGAQPMECSNYTAFCGMSGYNQDPARMLIEALSTNNDPFGAYISDTTLDGQRYTSFVSHYYGPINWTGSTRYNFLYTHYEDYESYSNDFVLSNLLVRQSTVPPPSAVWLFGSVVALGMARLRRRK